MRLKGTLKAVLVAAMIGIPGLAYAQAYGTVATDTLNVRAGAKTDSSILKQIGLGTSVEIVSQEGDWLKLILEDDSRAYVKAEYINVHRALAVIDVNGGLNVRDYPSTELGEVIGKFQSGDEISVSCRVGDWYKVSQEGFDGYVYKDYVKNCSQVDFLGYLPTKKLTEIERATVTQEEALSATVEVESYTESNSAQSSNQGTSHKQNATTNKKPVAQNSASSQGSATGQAIVNYAKQFLGNPYVYGGNSLTNGIDCSGFTSQVMRHFGISLNRNSAAQYANNGRYVDSSSLQPGDLIFYGYSGQVSHVAIYIGGGQIIHANDERTGICIGNAFPSRGKAYIGAKRVI